MKTMAGDHATSASCSYNTLSLHPGWADNNRLSHLDICLVCPSPDLYPYIFNFIILSHKLSDIKMLPNIESPANTPFFAYPF